MIKQDEHGPYIDLADVKGDLFMPVARLVLQAVVISTCLLMCAVVFMLG